MLRIVIAALITTLLFGCSSLDNSLMETAETLRPGSFKVGPYIASSVVPHEALKLTEEYHIYDKNDGDSFQVDGCVLGARLSIGLCKNVELISNLSLMETKKFSIKYRLPVRDSTLMIAIMPTYTKYTGEFDYDVTPFLDKSEPEAIYETFTSKGYELPILFTKKHTKYFTSTIAVKAAYYPIKHKFKYDYNEYEPYHFYSETISGSDDMYMAGLSANLQLYTWFFYLTPAVGFDYVYISDKYQKVVPSLGLGLGFQINPQSAIRYILKQDK